jgi:hypothetical protein
MTLLHPPIHLHPFKFHRKKRQPKFSRNCPLKKKKKKNSNSGSLRVTRRLPGEVLTSSPIIQKKKQKAKRKKSNFVEMFTIRTPVILTNVITVAAVKTIRENYYETKHESRRLHKMISLLITAAWELHIFHQILHRLWRQKLL